MHKDIVLHEHSTGHMHYFDIKNGGTIYWIWTKKRELPVLLHEFLHVTFYVLMDKDIKVSWKNQEPFCYYQQFLFNEFRAKDKSK